MQTSIASKIIAGVIAFLPNSANKEEAKYQNDSNTNVATANANLDELGLNNNYLATIARNEHKVLVDNVEYTSSYSPRTKFATLIQNIMNKQNNSLAIDSNDLQKLFNELKNDKSAKISLKFLYNTLKNVNTEEAVDSIINFVIEQNEPKYLTKILNYIANEGTNLPSKAMQDNLVNRQDLEIIKIVDRFQYTSLIKKGLKSELSSSELIKSVAHGFRLSDYEMGREIKFAINFWGKNNFGSNKDKQLMLPLFHFLVKIERHYPNLLGTLESSYPNEYKATLEKIYNEVKLKRVEFEKTAIIQSGMKVTSLLHEDAEFKDIFIKDLTKQLDLKENITLKPSRSAGTLASVKSKFLEALTNIATDSNQKHLVWTSSHGGPLHIWLTGGEVGSHKSDDLYRPDAISYKEICDALLKNLKPKLASKEITNVNFEHIVFIADQCIQYNMVQNLCAELQNEISKYDVSIDKLPLFITPAQDGMVAYKLTQYDSETIFQNALLKVINSKPLSSSFKNQNGILKNIPKEKVITISDIFRADEHISRDFYSSIAKFTEPSNIFTAKPNEKYPLGQDTAIFDNGLLDLKQFLDAIFLDLKSINTELPDFNSFKKEENKPSSILFELGERSKLLEELFG